jgi:sugar lactone lactonase YvrE
MLAFPSLHLSKSAVLAFGALAALVAVPAARAADTYAAQIPFSFTSLTLVTPTGVAVAANGTVYIADPGLGSVVQIVPTTGYVTGTAEGAASIAGTATKLTTGLTVPAAVAVDSNGNLYVADATDKKVIELPYPVTTSTPVTITYSGAETPTALAVDPNNNLYIADETLRAIYKVPSGTTTGTKLAITIPGVTLEPVGLAADAAGDVYFANHNNIVYEYNATLGTTAAFLTAPTAGAWKFSGTAAKYPIGMGLDPAGNLYVMDSGYDTGTDPGHLIQITLSAAANNQLPLTPGVTANGLAVSSIGNLYISDNTGNTADEIFYNNNPFNFGPLPAGTHSPAVTVNFLFSTAAPTSPVIYQSMQGGITTEFSSTDSATTINTDCGSPATSCSLGFYVTYSSSYSGTRNGVVGLTDNNHDLFTVPNTGISEASSLALYPGTQSILSQASRTLYEPQGLAVTGNDGTLFVADEGQLLSGGTVTYTHGAVWEYTVTSGFPGATATKVGSFTTPDALALDKAGNLYVADYGGSNGITPSVTKMPVSTTAAGNAWSGFGTALTFPTSAALTHPMALAFDPWGNLYIGDMGPNGVDATASTPGYIVEVPAGGGPAVRLNYSVGGVPIVFPDALAFDSFGNLYIADGGDGNTDLGGVDFVPVGTSTPVAISFSSLSTPLNQPSGLGFDAANDLYVLDGFNQRVLVVPMSFPGGVPTPSTDISLLGQGNSGLSTVVTPSNLVVWPGGQTVTVTDIGYQPQSGTGSPTQVLTLQAVNEAGGDVSAGPISYTGIDVGNEEIHFQAPGNTNPGSFALSECGLGGTTLAIGTTTNCTPTVTFIGTGAGAQATTITLNGTLATDFSALGNTIAVTGEVSEPVAGLTAPTISFSATNTATLSNTGNVALTISSIQVSGDATRAGGTCPASPGAGTLAAGSSCTVIFTINNIFSTGTVTVTDNSGNVAGSQQTASTFYLFNFGGFAVPAGGGIGSGFDALTLPAADIPRDLLNESTSTPSNTLSQPANKKGGKKGN